MNTSPETYSPIFKLIKDEALKEWVAQGHNMTGKVVEELDFIVKELADSTLIEIWMHEYGKYQDTGVKAADIPYSRGSGAGSSAYIDALTKWVQARMSLSAKKAKPVAFAIAETHKKEGMPTSGSYAYSDNGKRKDWFTDTMERNEDTLRAMLYDIVYKVVEIDFSNMIKQIQHELIT